MCLSFRYNVFLFHALVLLLLQPNIFCLALYPYSAYIMDVKVVNKNENIFYTKARDYWSEVPPTLDGMLGGFGFISQTDIQGSHQLLKELFRSKNPPGRSYALDCGAGIGRISKFLLTELFDQVDLVEQNADFLERAKNYLGPKSLLKIGKLYSVGLQDYVPEKEKYDVIWIQWVLGHLTDEDLIRFFNSCRTGLKPNGVIIVKENVTSCGEIEVDEQDSSVTRPLSLYRELFTKANFDCYRQMKQRNFPKGIYSVYMFVLKPFKKCNSCFYSNQHICDSVVPDQVAINDTV